MTDRQDRRLSTSEAIKVLHCSMSHIHRIPPEDLPYEMVGNRRRYKLSDLDDYAELKRRP